MGYCDDHKAKGVCIKNAKDRLTILEEDMKKKISTRTFISIMSLFIAVSGGIPIVTHMASTRAAEAQAAQIEDVGTLVNTLEKTQTKWIATLKERERIFHDYPAFRMPREEGQ
jgi:hypothetical protein